MSSGIRNTVLASAAFIIMVLGMFFYSMTRVPVLDAQALQQLGVVVLPSDREIADFELTDHRGEPFNLGSLANRWSFLFFGFTSCPDICPVAMAALAKARRELEAESELELLESFNAVLVTVDPERDDAEKLGTYVTAFSPVFTGVTGSREDLAEFARQLNVAFMKVPLGADDYSVDHTGNIVIINPQGRYHGFIKMPHDAENILLGYRSVAAAF